MKTFLVYIVLLDQIRIISVSSGNLPVNGEKDTDYKRADR